VSAPLPAALPPSIPIVDSPCFLCGAAAADPVWRTPDRAFGVPGSYAVVRCRSCGFLYQRPRVADAHLAACYPDHYPRHQEPSPRVPLKGKPGRVRAARWALASGLGYRDWLAPGGLLIVEVPNVGGLGAALFGRAWSGLELPRHLSHFTPASLEQAVERAGGRVVWRRQQAKPRHYLWSLRIWLRDRGAERLARLTEWRPAYGALKLGLELALPLVARAGRGEAIRVGVRPQ
jgi:hypothetical protein